MLQMYDQDYVREEVRGEDSPLLTATTLRKKSANSEIH